MTSKIEIVKDLPNRKLNVTRAFNAPVEKVWKAWTDSALLDKWWAPKPWRAETKTMDFTEGGMWLYCMKGPNGEAAWCRVSYQSIDPQLSFTALNSFADEDGNPSSDFPVGHWLVEFKPTETGTMVLVTITFDSEADMNKLVAMGFEQGFSMGLGNLEELLASEEI